MMAMVLLNEAMSMLTSIYVAHLKSRYDTDDTNPRGGGGIHQFNNCRCKNGGSKSIRSSSVIVNNTNKNIGRNA